MSTPPHPDQRLVWLLDQVANKDDQALKELYESTSGKLYGLALRVVGKHEYAEDVLQESFLNVWRVAGSYRESLSPPMAWLSLMVRSRALDLLRKLATQQDGKLDSLDNDDGFEIASQEVGQFDTMLAGQQATALHQCLSKIESDQRNVIVWAYYKDLSHSELAEVFKLPVGTVKTWIRRGMAQLKTCMGGFV